MNPEQRLQSEKDFHNQVFSDDSRQSTDKYYRSTGSSMSAYLDLITTDIKGKTVMEYGCGPRGAAFPLARKGANVTAIDISDVAIELTREHAARNGLAIDCQLMDAEKLTFDDRTFDLICGSGILHHLDLEPSYRELSRTLKPYGKAVFYEPLGHNPLINLYRRLTPSIRTDDEHPLLMDDIALAEKYFASVKVFYFNLTATVSSFIPLLQKPLSSLDSFLFARLPWLRKHAWIVVIELSQPRNPA